MLHVFVFLACGRILKSTASSGYLSSPSKNRYGGFTSMSPSVIQSGDYPAGVDCSYIIAVPSGRAIRLTWNSFDINGNMPDCSSGDYVEVFIGCKRYSIGKYCSSNAQRPFDMFSVDGCMMLKFHSNSKNTTGKGFQAQYSTFSYLKSKYCTLN